MNRRPVSKDLISLQPGEILFRQGDPGDSMYLIVSGSMQIVKNLLGIEREVNLLEIGDFFGQVSLLQGDPRSATAKALTEVKLLCIEKAGFEDLLQLDVEIPIRMMRQLNRSLQMSERRLEKVLSKLSERERKQIEMAPVELTGARAVGPVVAELALEDGSKRWPIFGAAARLGRTDKVTGITPEVDLGGVPERNTVSRYHARLLFDSSAFQLVEEVGVKNGTFVNGQRLKSGVPFPLKGGDRVRVGDVSLRFEQMRA